MVSITTKVTNDTEDKYYVYKAVCKTIGSHS